MHWLAEINQEKIDVKLPDRVVEGSSFALEMGSAAYRCEYHPALHAIFLSPDVTGELERVVRIRNHRLVNNREDSSIHASLELVSGTVRKAARIEVSLQPNIPGQAFRKGNQAKKPATVVSPITGKVIQVLVKEGQVVAKGDVLLVIEAMKMENKIAAPQAGKVTGMAAVVAGLVTSGMQLMKIEPLVVAAGSDADSKKASH
jgi:biotin carboxyl carrier protein